MTPFNTSFQNKPLILDHPGVGQEFLEIDAHALGVGGVGGAEIDQQHADALRLDLGCRPCTSRWERPLS